MAEVAGLTLAKVDGTYDVQVKGSRWSVKRVVNQIPTGGGVVESVGQEIPSGSFDEVIPLSGGVNWRALRNFALQIYDQATQKILIASFEGCNWDGIDGSSDEASATAARNVTWKGTKVNKA